jgi:hypothetical protein
VGVGKNDPGYKLDVNGEINATGLRINGTPFSGSQWTDGSGLISYSAGNVGIGTGATSSKLAVVGGDVSIGANSISHLGGNITTLGVVGLSATRSGGVRLGSSDGSLDGYFYGADGAFYLGSGSSHPLHLVTNGTPKATIDSSGNVAIGTSPSESYKLNVAGNINATQTITANNIVAKYQDVAEWVPSSEQLPAGTVVVLDSTKSNQVTSSSKPYDTRVAGVVSEQPGIALGEQSDSKVLVATTGRVKVKVDASKGPIHIGDLLVTSDVPGVAMKSKEINLGGVKIHRPGTLIGKALEPLEKGKGEILVLLSLQ